MKNSSHNVVITFQIFQEAIELLKKRRVRFKISKDFKEADGIVCLLTDKIGREQLERATKLKVISLMAAGYDNIDIEYCRSRGIVVTNTPGILTHATADLTFALILAAARRITESDRFLRAGNFTGWQPDLFLGADLYRKTIGIIGAGKIGQEVGKRARSFSMNILYSSRTRKKLFEVTTGAKWAPFERLMQESDFITINCPLTNETHHLISNKEFNLMKSTSVLVNTARGPVVDENALVIALKKRKIFAAGLDVYEHEPSVTKALLELENVVLLPHIGSATAETRKSMANIAVRNLLNILEGREPLFRAV